MFTLKTNVQGPYAFVTDAGNLLQSNTAGPNVLQVFAAGDFVIVDPTGRYIRVSTFVGAFTIPVPAGIPNANLKLDDGQVVQVISGTGA